MSIDQSILVGTPIGARGRDRASGIRWQRITAARWDLWHRAQCTCERPRWPGLDLETAAARLAAEQPTQETA